MYLRTTKRTLADGTVAKYLQLAHNVWDSDKQRSTTNIIHSFGRQKDLDRAAIRRLIDSLSRVLEPEQALEATAAADLEFVAAERLGAVWALDGVWHQLGIDGLLDGLLDDRRLADAMERVIFGLVANRACAPSSKLAATRWVADEVAIEGLESVDVDACYRAMDWLVDIEDELAGQVYAQVADLLNLEVDLLFFDTTSTYFETDQADPAETGGEDGCGDDDDGVGFRTYGKSKDHRPGLPQVIVGMAVTRTGVPIRVWCWPGNTGDAPLIRQVKDDLAAWKLNRVVWVADRAFNSEQNRRYLQRAGGHYILAEKLRSGSEEAQAALSRQGRYRTVAGRLQVKQVVVDDGVMRDRFVICRNPDQADRDAAVRQAIVAQLQEAIADTDDLDADDRDKLAGRLAAKPAFRRFLRTTPTGKLRINRTAIREEAKLDGKFLLRTSDDTLSAEDVALGYKQLLQVEAGWRDLKHTLDLRPVFHRREDRIRAHVVLCWLALLLVRIIENTCQDTWPNLRRQLNQLHVGTFDGPAGTVHQTTAPTGEQQAIFNALNIDPPPRFTHLQANSADAA